MASIAKIAMANLVKLLMGIGLLAGIVGIPVVLFSQAWFLLGRLYHQHTFWFFVLAIPVLYIAVKLWKWLYELLSAMMMAVGAFVDRLESDDSA